MNHNNESTTGDSLPNVHQWITHCQKNLRERRDRAAWPKRYGSIDDPYQRQEINRFPEIRIILKHFHSQLQAFSKEGNNDSPHVQNILFELSKDLNG